MSIYNIFKFIPNVLEPRKKASLILFSVDEEDLAEIRRKSPGLIKNILIVGDRKPRKSHDNEYYINNQEWEEDEQEYMEKTKGAFVIHDQLDDDESDFYDRMENYKKYYPVVFVSPREDNDFFSDHISGWKSVKTKTGVIIFVNKGRKNFDSYTVNMKKLFEKSDVKPLVSTRISKDNKGREIVEEIFSSGRTEKKKTEVEKVEENRNTEEDWSIFANLPTPSMDPDHSNPTWVKEFYLYLKELVSRITPPGKEKLIDVIVNKKTIQNVWFHVFTGMYINLNPGENYEVYEAVGDSVLKYVFYIYLYQRFAPNIDKDQLNDLKTMFLSKGWQAVAGEKMGLTNWLLNIPELRNHPSVREDMQEAFCWGIEKILNEYSPNGGYARVMLLYMFDKIFKDYYIDLSKKLTPEQTMLEQWYPQVANVTPTPKLVIKKPQSIDRKDWVNLLKDFEKVMIKNGIMMPITENAGKNESGIRYESDVNPDGSATFRVYLNEAGYKVLKDKGFPVSKFKNKLLVEVKSSTLSQAKTDARIKAMKKLESIGLTQEWQQKQKIEKNIKNVTGIDQALEKARQEHGKIIDVYPVKAVTKQHYSIFQLYGIKKDGRKIVLENIVIFNNQAKKHSNVFQDLVDKYLSSSEEDGSSEDEEDDGTSEED